MLNHVDCSLLAHAKGSCSLLPHLILDIILLECSCVTRRVDRPSLPHLPPRRPRRALHLDKPQRPIHGIPHLLLDPRLELLLPLGNILRARLALCHGGPDDLFRNHDAHLPHALDVRQQRRRGVLQRGAQPRDALDGGDEHAVRQMAGAGEHAGHADAGEDDGVVALGDVDGDFSLVVTPGARDGGKGGAGCDEGFAVGPLEDVGGFCLVEARWVGEREDHGAGVVGGHGFDDGLCKGACDCGCAD